MADFLGMADWSDTLVHGNSVANPQRGDFL
jgi:hypothetical protein